MIMSKFKGTQGKWKARIGYRIDVITDDDRAFGICDIGTEQELYLSNYNLDEAKANAQLIASVPELLDTLQGIIDAQYGKGKTLADLNSRIDKAKRVVMKALTVE